MALKRIAITGSSGRLGAPIAQHLANSGCQVIGIDCVAGAQTSVLVDLGSTSKAAQSAIARALLKVDVVIHLAALHAPHVGVASEQAFFRTNVVATQQLLNLAVEAGVQTFILASSTSIYGDALSAADTAVWIDENVAPQPRDIYDHTKLEAESLCREIAKRELIKCRVLRVARCFPEAVDKLLWYRTHRGVGLDDVVHGFERAVKSEWVDNFGVYNLCADSPFSEGQLRDLKDSPTDLLASLCPRLMQWFKYRGAPVPQSIDRVYCCRRAINELGYRPQEDAETLAKALLLQSLD